MPSYPKPMPGSLRPIAAALGGDLYAGGRRANVPAPGHGPADRSVSLLLSGDRLIAHSFGAATWQAALDDLRARGLIDAENRLTGVTGRICVTAPSPPTRARRIATARELWRSASPLRPETPAGLYCRRRGAPFAAQLGSALRAHHAVPAAAYRPDHRTYPALLAAVQDAAGNLAAVEITALTADGRRRRIPLPRKLVGVCPPGAAVRLTTADTELLVAEGVFTALTAIRLFDLPGWALLGAHNLARWRPPSGVRRVLIAADPGAAGERAAATLRAGLLARGLAVQVRPPPQPYSDWNALLLAGQDPPI